MDCAATGVTCYMVFAYHVCDRCGKRSAHEGNCDMICCKLHCAALIAVPRQELLRAGKYICLYMLLLHQAESAALAARNCDLYLLYNTSPTCIFLEGLFTRNPICELPAQGAVVVCVGATE